MRGQLLAAQDSTDSVNGSDNLIETPRAVVAAVPRPIVDISIGLENVWVTTSAVGQELWCWGDNSSHECGIRGDVTSTGNARQVDYFPNASVIANGFRHTCAIVGGVVQCIGTNGDGELGDPAAPSSDGIADPVTVLLPAGTVSALEAGDEHACALIAGAVHCWGENSAGQLGNGTTVDTDIAGVILRVVLPADDATAIDVHDNYGCALRPGDELWCWGRNNFDIFRTGVGPAFVPGPVQVPGVSATDMALGDDHICVVNSADSSVSCWGSNAQGQLGVDRPFLQRSPTTTVIVCEP